MRVQAAAQAGKPALTPAAILAAKPRPLSEVIAEDKRIKLDTPQLEGTISLKGARIDDVELRNYYTTENGTGPGFDLFSCWN